MRSILTIAVLACSATVAAGQPLELDLTTRWTRQIGTSAIDYIEGLAPDGANGFFACGATGGSLGGTNAGLMDGWVARYNFAGSQLWIRQIGTSASDDCHTKGTMALSVSAAGGFFVSGTTGGNLGGLSAGLDDAWLALYDGVGNRVWIRQLGTTGTDLGIGTAADNAGGVYIAGQTDGNLGGQNAGREDGWVARYNSQGQQLWIRQLGTDSSEYLRGIASAPNGGVYVTGYTTGNLGGPNAGRFDMWIARYDASGVRLWTRQYGTTQNEAVRSTTSDGSGGLYVNGITGGSFGGPFMGQADAWVGRFNDLGNPLWIRQLGSPGNEQLTCTVPDGLGNVFITGWTDGNLGGPNAGARDYFLARYNTSGVQLSLRQYGTIGTDEGMSLAPDGLGGVYVGGQTDKEYGGSYAGLVDVFFVAFGPEQATVPIEGEQAGLHIDGAIPNPMKEHMVVSFTLAAPDEVQLEMVDVTGRQVYSREWAGLEAGPHSVDVAPAGDLVPGVYIIKVSAGKLRATKKVVIAP